MRSHVRSVGATGDRSERFTFALNFPGALLTATLILFPLGLVLFLSLRVNDGALLNVDLTLSNLITALADPLYQRVIARSLLIAGLVTLATVVTAYPVAYTIAFYGGRYKALLLFLVSLPVLDRGRVLMGMMIVRHKVRDYGEWRPIFDQHAEMQRGAGLINPRVLSFRRQQQE